MNTKFSKRIIKILLLGVIFFINLTVLFIQQISLNSIDNDGIMDEFKFPNIIKSANNDTTPPVITFIQPETNNLTIKSKFYDIIVNITDSNPPLPGNVSLEISNATISLFNSSMTLFGEDEWYFTWVNISSYPNREVYSFRVTAKDSSVNENIGISPVINVYVEISKSPGIINIIFYIVAASLLIAGISVYINKKHSHLLSRDDNNRVDKKQYYFLPLWCPKNF